MPPQNVGLQEEVPASCRLWGVHDARLTAAGTAALLLAIDLLFQMLGAGFGAALFAMRGADRDTSCDTYFSFSISSRSRCSKLDTACRRCVLLP